MAPFATLSSSSALSRSISTSSDSTDQVLYSLSRFLVFVGKVLWLLFLIALFALSLVVWLWVISFRSGWRFWMWVEERDNQQISAGIFYGLLVLIITPFFLFVNWAQQRFDQVLPEWVKLPAQFPLRRLFEERLGIQLGEEFPFFIEQTQDAQDL
jgi:hypothetical protein